jgi:peroxiredoxin Q/BCP
MKFPKVGSVAPGFALPDQNGKTHKLSDYKGKWVLLYFYPRDNTTGCTIEACEIREEFQQFEKIGAVVLGVSADTAESHRKFADKYKLPFTLLSDVEKKAIRGYRVWGKKQFMGRTYMGILRTSFLIDPKGKIAKVYEKVKPKIHAGEVIADLKDLVQ